MVELDVGHVVDGSLPEVRLMEVGIHVDSGDAEVVRTRNIRNDALTVLPHARLAHPHIPVPRLPF